MPRSSNGKAGLRSDGELVQALADTFDFAVPQEASGLLLPAVVRASEPAPTPTPDKGHGGWIDVLDVSAPINRAGSDPDDDDGLPDIIVWCLDGNGTGSATGGREEIMLAFEIETRTWSVNGEIVDDAGFSALLFL